MPAIILQWWLNSTGLVTCGQCPLRGMPVNQALMRGMAIAVQESGGRKTEMKKALLTLALGSALLAPMSASAAVRVFIGGGPVVYGGFYRPFWGPYWGPYGYSYYPNAGEVKLDTKVKDAQVFINGAYAGTTHDNKTMHLRAGSYNIEIREHGQTPFAEKVYVAAGKTIHLQPEL
jgi:hypothetical protein